MCCLSQNFTCCSYHTIALVNLEEGELYLDKLYFDLLFEESPFFYVQNYMFPTFV